MVPGVPTPIISAALPTSQKPNPDPDQGYSYILTGTPEAVLTSAQPHIHLLSSLPFPIGPDSYL